MRPARFFATRRSRYPAQAIHRSRGAILGGDAYIQIDVCATQPTKDLKAIKTIRMVVKDGTFYYPTEVYPKFGIEPFTTVPSITPPAKSR